MNENDGAVPPRADRPGGVGGQLPPVSVIVPVRNDPANLDLCLEALKASDHPDFEIVVVDDGSTDDSGAVAAGHGVRLIRREESSGPAVARNAGARAARHPYLFFIDADVCVQADTLRRGAEAFAGDPTVDAIFGSYDSSPGASNLISQYRNLLHHFVHQQGRREAFTFWSGCGAIKRSLFLEMGGFDTGYGTASIEDIELGARLRQAGRRVVLVKELQAKHLKRWTLRRMVETDVFQRAIPWTLLLLSKGHLPQDLNLKASQRLSVLFTFGLGLMFLLGSWIYQSLLLVPLAVLLGVVLVDRWTLGRPVPALLRILIVVAGGATVAAVFWGLASGRGQVQLWLLLCLGLFAGIVVLNLRFYVFLVKLKGPLFLPLAVPLHILYFLYGGLGFALAAGWYAAGGRRLGLGLRHSVGRLTAARPAEPRTRETIDERLHQAFARYDPVALGGAVGAVAAVGLFLATAVLLLRPEEIKGPTLSLLGQVLFGYEVSWSGSAIGALQAGAGGFAFGYVLAWMVNLLVATVEAKLWRELETIRNSDG